MPKSQEPSAPQDDTKIGRGRPPVLTPERHAQFVRLANAGNPFEVCAHAVGVSEAHARRWYALGTGDDAEDPYATFQREVRKAAAESEARNVTIIATAAREDWHAAAWLLERGAPERWARASQRAAASDAAQVKKPSDPFSEVDELAARRRA